MYTGQSQRGLGCSDCANRPTATGLGIAPAVAAVIIKNAPQIEADIVGLFTGSSYDETHQAIQDWVHLILSDPITAVSGNYIPGGAWTSNAAMAYLALNCWAGNEGVLPTYRKISGDPAPAGCGCEVSHGCRADAQAALVKVNAALNQPDPTVSSAPQPVSPSPSQYASTSQYGSTAASGSGSTASSFFNATLFGIPVIALALGGLVFAFAGGHSRGRGR